jgi:hypothetical protein
MLIICGKEAQQWAIHNKWSCWGLLMSLVDELNKAAIEKPKSGHGVGRMLFVAQQGEIRQALDAGYTMTEIWKHLNEKGKMPITYRVFAEYTYRFIKKVKKEVPAAPVPQTGRGDGQPRVSTVQNTNMPKQTINTERAGREPRGIGNVHIQQAFGDPVDMTDKLTPID